MDYETKIYLDKLIEAVDKLNSPDWWTIGITVVNAIIMIWLGWRQYKLQQRQTKQQDYEPNKELLVIIKGIDNQIEHHLYTLFYMLIDGVKSSIISRFSELKTELDALVKQVNDHKIDFELRFPAEKTLISDYIMICFYMYNIYSTFQKHIENENIDLEIIFDIDKAAKIISLGNDEKFKEEILFYIKDENVHKSIMTSIDRFIKKKNSILDKKYADKIAERCKID